MATPFDAYLERGPFGAAGYSSPTAPAPAGQPALMASYQPANPYPVNTTAQLPEYAGLEQALLGQSQRAFTDPGGTLDLLRQQFSASGLGNSGVLLGAQQRAETQRQGGLAEQLAQLRVQRAMAQLEQRRFADQLGFQDYQGGLNRQFQAQQGDLAFQRQQQLIQQQRDYEQEQQKNNLIGSLVSGGLGFLTGGVGGLLSGGLLGGGHPAQNFFTGAFAGPGALAGAQLSRNQMESFLNTDWAKKLYDSATTRKPSFWDTYHLTPLGLNPAKP